MEELVVIKGARGSSSSREELVVIKGARGVEFRGRS